MDLKYKHLSAGYLGWVENNTTLNSRFYGSFYNAYAQNDSFLGEIILLFPQRIPRIGFFDELKELEDNKYKTHFDETVTQNINFLKCISEVAQVTETEINMRHCINWANLCLRYGCFNDLLEILPNSFSMHSFDLEMRLIKEAAKIEYKLSTDKQVSINNYLTLADQYLLSKRVRDREKIMLLNQLIVTYYRHQKNPLGSNKIFDYAKMLEKLLDNFDKNIPLNTLYRSVGYRGLAMVEEFGDKNQFEFLRIAENLATNMPIVFESDKIVALENQYTCFQSIAKWHQQKDDKERALSYLKKMIDIDPFDSTAYSERGFHHIKYENYTDASLCFEKAIRLGPPGTGMNAYYLAQCLEKLGKPSDALIYLLESTKLDQQAVSPLIDLIDYYITDNKIKLAQEIVTKIFTNDILFEQLEDDEIIKLQNIIY